MYTALVHLCQGCKAAIVGSIHVKAETGVLQGSERLQCGSAVHSVICMPGASRPPAAHMPLPGPWTVTAACDIITTEVSNTMLQQCSSAALRPYNIMRTALDLLINRMRKAVNGIQYYG